jgi:hypothetical protein
MHSIIQPQATSLTRSDDPAGDYQHVWHVTGEAKLPNLLCKSRILRGPAPAQNNTEP